jgi:acyl-CoA reductase-like NAD-dependent aldehyde dehydrogenase
MNLTPSLQSAPLEERRRWLIDLEEQLLAHRDELARIITLEQGKPLTEVQATAIV